MPRAGSNSDVSRRAKSRFGLCPRAVAEARERSAMLSRSYTQILDVVDGVPQELTIQLSVGNLVGSVQRGDGEPVTDARVEARPIKDGDQFSNLTMLFDRTDSKGRFKIRDLPVGTWGLQVRDDSGRADKTGITVVPGIDNGPVQVTLRSTVTVRGRVDRSSFEERPRWMIVEWKRVDEVDDLYRTNGRGFVVQDDTFTVRNLLPGTYEVSWRGQNLPSDVRAPTVVVGSEGLDDFEVR